MVDETPCAAVEVRLTQALLAREQPDAASRAHAEACDVCGPLLRRLAELHRELEAAPTTCEVPEALARATLSRACALLASETSVAGRVPAGLPEGFSGECLRLLGAALLPLPLVVAWNLALLALGEHVLRSFVPAALLWACGAAYLAAAAGWSALVYGSIPILAHRRARRRSVEATP